jgi:hypothetical protein
METLALILHYVGKPLFDHVVPPDGAMRIPPTTIPKKRVLGSVLFELNLMEYGQAIHGFAYGVVVARSAVLCCSI